MSKQEAEYLINRGKNWSGKVWIGQDVHARDELIGSVNHDLAALKISISRGWQDYDPVVRVDNKPHTYAALVDWAVSQEDGGVASAKLFKNWYSTDNTALADLPDDLRAVAVITHFAEIGRGYESELERLYKWIESIADAPNVEDARSRWRSYKESYPPSLKYDEDAKKEFSG